MTPAFTGPRTDEALHGWVVFPGFGRAKFTDGTMVAFEPVSELRNPEEATGALTALSLDLEAPIYMEGETLGLLRVKWRTAEAICQTCSHLMTDDHGSGNVLQRFWLHQVFEHHVPPDLIGVEGLEQIGAVGIHLAVQVVVRSMPQS